MLEGIFVVQQPCWSWVT